jgi:N-acyl-D-amino-acid deacylase
MQGVTTDISGNCGMSAAPFIGEAATARQRDKDEFGVTDNWSTMAGFLDLMDSKRPAVNFATYVGHGNVRASVLGYADRMPDEAEYEAMTRLVSESMEAGALGLSTGLIYPPGVYSNTDEIVRLAAPVREYGGIYTSHMRSESARLVEAIEETIAVGRGAGVGVQISHIKTGGPANWHKLSQVIDTFERARAEGVDVTADRYPYTASSTDLDAILPAWSYEGGARSEIERMLDPETRKRLRQEIIDNHPVPDYWNRVMISSVVTDRNKRLEGMTMAEAAETLGLEPVDALFQILIEEEIRVGAVYFMMSEDNLKAFYGQDWVMIGSDATARNMTGPTRHGKPHPRTFGSFPRVLGKYVREESVMSLPVAIRKMTSMPAERLGLEGRGALKPGSFADIVVFDPATVIDTATFQEPYAYPEGVVHVFVNGVQAVRGGEQTDARAGRVLRK